MNRSKKIVNMAMEVNRKRRAHELLETQKETQGKFDNIVIMATNFQNKYFFTFHRAIQRTEDWRVSC